MAKIPRYSFSAPKNDYGSVWNSVPPKSVSTREVTPYADPISAWQKSAENATTPWLNKSYTPNQQSTLRGLYGLYGNIATARENLSQPSPEAAAYNNRVSQYQGDSQAIIDPWMQQAGRRQGTSLPPEMQDTSAIDAEMPKYDPYAARRVSQPEMSYPQESQDVWNKMASERSAVAQRNATASNLMQTADRNARLSGVPIPISQASQDGATVPGSRYSNFTDWTNANIAAREAAMAGKTPDVVGPWKGSSGTPATPSGYELAARGVRVGKSGQLTTDENRANKFADAAARQKIANNFRKDLVVSRATGIPWQQVNVARRMSQGEPVTAWEKEAAVKGSGAFAPESFDAQRQAANAKISESLARGGATPDVISAAIKQNGGQPQQASGATIADRIALMTPDDQKKANKAYENGDEDALNRLFGKYGYAASAGVKKPRTNGGVVLPTPIPTPMESLGNPGPSVSIWGVNPSFH